MNRNRSASLLLLMTVSVLLFASRPATAEPLQQEHGPAVYTSEYRYAGIYDRTRLYRRYPGAIEWRAGREPALLEEVTCGSARGRLARYGIWSGALKADGTCWNSEPQDFATGNYLNYLIFNHPEN
jgi:hypothetical protein